MFVKLPKQRYPTSSRTGTSLLSSMFNRKPPTSPSIPETSPVPFGNSTPEKDLAPFVPRNRGWSDSVRSLPNDDGRRRGWLAKQGIDDRPSTEEYEAASGAQVSHPPRSVSHANSTEMLSPRGHPLHHSPSRESTSPFAIRRQILTSDLSESLRRNLVWERQVNNHGRARSKPNVRGGISHRDVSLSGSAREDRDKSRSVDWTNRASKRGALPIVKSKSWADGHYSFEW
jgi:hypothetical protein